MLKSIVNGAEHDIVSIPMKTRNLFNLASIVAGRINGTTGDIEYSSNTTIHSVSDNSITFSTSVAWRGFTTDFIQTSNKLRVGIGSFTGGDGATFNAYQYAYAQDKTFLGFIAAGSNAPNETQYIRVSFQCNVIVTNAVATNIMLNTGSTALPYEPYGYQNGWEIRDNQNRLIWGREDELQTTTGTLMFNGYDLPVKVNSLLGNATQNGTPSPSPVNPNLVDPSKTVPGYQQSNGTIHEPSSGNERTTDWIPFTTDTLYAIVSGSNNGNINWVLYDSNKQPLYFYGPTFSPNTVIIISRSGYSAAAFIRISWTNAINQPICVTTEQRSEYIPFDPNPSGPIIPEMCGVRTGNLIDKTEFAGVGATIEQIEDGVRIITQSNGYAAKITLNVLSNTDYYISYVFKNITSGTNRVRVFAGTGTTTEIASFSSSGGTFNTGNNTKINIWFYAAFGAAATVEYTNIMLNTGSNALQFEPYGWEIPFENHGENLCSISTWTNSQSTDTRSHFQIRVLAYMGNTIVSASPYVNTSNPGVYTTSITLSETADKLVIKHNGSSRDLIVANVMINGTAGESYTVSMYVETNDPTTMDGIKVRDIMLNSGSTPLPYSPYLNKTTPIYLGEVPTIRRIKKLVLTGEENWTYESAYTRFYTTFKNTLIIGVRATPAFCTHFQVISDSRPLADTPNNSMYSNSVNSVWFFKKTEYTDVDAWKSYLADQYANGTPVTIWYILKTPETGIVNEPLAKIGDYTDELTEISVHNLSAPLYGIGDYKDILNLSTGVLTRNIKKFVLDGMETWYRVGSTHGYFTTIPNEAANSGANVTISSHYKANMTSADGTFRIGNSKTEILIYDNYTSVTDFKSYLAQQYQNGTPVTVWYVLATPETETITVPTGMTGEIEGYLTQISTPTPEHPSIPKWNGKEETGGAYSVTVYNLPEIPTTTGKNTLTVETEKIHGIINPLCGIGDYKDVLNLSTGIITRKIKKLVLTGEETGYLMLDSSSHIFGIRGILNSEPELLGVGGACTHFRYNNVTSSLASNMSDGDFVLNRIVDDYSVCFKVDSISSAPDAANYFSQQYQAGTPVTVWYVLETPETETITVPYGLECSVEGYLTQSGTPTPSNPITPDANGILESDGTYAVEVSLVPSNLTVKGHIKPIP